MAKLFALNKIILPATDKDGKEQLIDKGRVFDATPAQAKQFDAIKAARPATDAEIAADKEAKAIADGTAFVAPAPSDSVVETEADTPPAAVTGDPKGIPKGRSA